MTNNQTATSDRSVSAACSYLTPDEVCDRWRQRITPETLANWRALHIGPAYSKFGKPVLYRLDLLEIWEAKNVVRCDLPTASNGEQA